MAVTISKTPRGPRPRRRYNTPMSDINVTPLVDVMLVLLIVFMVTAPLLTVGISVDLPKTKGKALSERKEPLTVTLDAEGKVFLQNTEVKVEDLVAQLHGIADVNEDTRIYVRGDKSLNYGKIVEIMGLISSAGFAKVALVADMPKETPVAARRG